MNSTNLIPVLASSIDASRFRENENAFDLLSMIGLFREGASLESLTDDPEELEHGRFVYRYLSEMSPLELSDLYISLILEI